MSRLLHILLLRHGLTDANATGTIQGHQPTPLNATGHRQAQLLAQRLATYTPRPQVLISSDLPRAAQTAGHISAACDLPITYDPDLRERHMGHLEGKRAEELHIWRMAAGQADPPNAEPAAAFERRVYDVLTSLPTRHADARTFALVTHGGPCWVVLRMLIDGRLPLAPRAARPELVTIANCSILHLLHDAEAGTWQIHRLNDVEHLETATSADAG